MKLDLAKLKELAQAATPGSYYEAHDAFHAAANPAVVLALLARLERAEEALQLLVASVEAAEYEGLATAIEEQNGHLLADLLSRRILHHLPEARAALAAAEKEEGE
jgi:hypothetical protein